MGKTVVALVLASSVLTAPAHARDGSVYVGLEGGVHVSKGPDLDVNGTSDAVHLKTNTGWDADAVFGYDFGRFRLEAEAGYKQSNQQQLIANGAFDVDAVSPGVQSAASVNGDIEVKSVMANALLDIGRDGGVNVYAGAGVGHAWTEFNTQIFGVVTPYLDDNAKGLAWQLIAGLRLPITRHLDVGAKYRFFNVEGLEMTSPTSGAIETSLRTHSLLASVILNFGGAAPPPPPPAAFSPPPPPPAPPPPPQLRACPDGSQVPVAQACPVPPPPVVAPSGERG